MLKASQRLCRTPQKTLFLLGVLVLFSIFLIGIVNAEDVNLALDGTAEVNNLYENGCGSDLNILWSADNPSQINDNDTDTWQGVLAESDLWSSIMCGLLPGTNSRSNTRAWVQHKYEAIVTFPEPAVVNKVEYVRAGFADTVLRGDYEKTFLYYNNQWNEIYDRNFYNGGWGGGKNVEEITDGGPWYDVTKVKVEISGYSSSSGDHLYLNSQLYELRAFGSLASVCGNNLVGEGEQCDDGNLIDGDGCSSECLIEPEPPECCKDSDCGQNYYSNNYCVENEVYRDYHDFDCILGKCVENIGVEFVKYCDYMCSDGECVDEPKEPACYYDSDCGIDHCIGTPNYCLYGDVYQDFRIYTCNNPGQTNSYCLNEIVPLLLEQCDYGCENGECIDEPEPPANVCGDNILNIGVEECDDGNTDNGDGCSSICEIEEPEPPEECCDDEDCHEDYYSNKYCSGENVYKDFHNFSCVDGECVENIIAKLVEECNDGCSNSKCIKDDDEDDEDDEGCRHCKDCDDSYDIYEEGVLAFHDEINSDSEPGKIILVGQPASAGQEDSVEKEKITDNSWVVYIFIGCIVLLVLILISLAVKR